MAKYQLQIHQVLDDGTDVFLYPINTALDVQVGKLSTGSLTLPGNASDEILAQTLANIKKYLTNLGTVAEQKRGVSDSTTSTSSIDLATSKAVNDLKVRIDGNDEILATHITEIAGKAPINHAVNALTYGGATGTLYGHVMLSDTYSTAVTNGSAEYSIGASQNALFNAYNALNISKAPNNHAVNNNSYGLGTSSLYGHVKLSDAYASKVTDGAAENALGVSQNALYNAYNELKTVNDEQATAIAGKAPTQHASTEAATYGAGTGSYYGHVMLSDAFDTDNSATGASANSIGASSWAVYRAYSNLATVVSTKLAATHADEVATASKFSHVKLSDDYTSSAGAASAGIGASSLAVYNTYAAFSSFKTSAENSISTLNSRYDELKKSVADGKTLLINTLSAYETNWSASWNSTNASWANIRDMINITATNRYNSGVSAQAAASINNASFYAAGGINMDTPDVRCTVNLSLNAGRWILVLTSATRPGCPLTEIGCSIGTCINPGYYQNPNITNGNYGTTVHSYIYKIHLAQTTNFSVWLTKTNTGDHASGYWQIFYLG